MALGAGEDFFFLLLLFPVGEGEDGEDAADGARVDDAADDGRDDEGVFTDGINEAVSDGTVSKFVVAFVQRV